MVIVPALFRMTAQHAKRLRVVVDAGGSIIVTYLSGYVDSQAHVHHGGYLRPISDVLGIRVIDIGPRGPNSRVGSSPWTPRLI